METSNHLALKRLAVRWLRERGCMAVAEEVRCPISRFRVDVAGYRDTEPRRSRRPGRAESPRPATVVVECKQSRGDFLRDGAERERLLRERADVERIARSIEHRRIRAEEPHLRLEGSALFADLEAWDYAGSRLRCYRDVMARIVALDRRLYGHTKFCTMSRYRLADELYVAAPRGLIRRGEIPDGWGLLEWDETLQVTVAAPVRSTCMRYRHRLLRNIAVAASYAVEKAARR